MSLVLTTYGRQAMVTQWWVRDLADATTSVWVAYTVNVPPANADGSQLEEPDPADGYGRLEIPLDSGHWAPTGFGEIFNALEDFFPSPTSDWGFISGLALLDDGAVGLGNVVATGVVAEPFRCPVGTTPRLDVGAITIGLYE